jgi:hypothetical protein
MDRELHNGDDQQLQRLGYELRQPAHRQQRAVANSYPDDHRDGDEHAYLYAHRNGHADANLYADRNGVEHSHANSYASSNCDGYGDTGGGDCDQHAFADGDAHEHTSPDCDQYAFANAHTHKHTAPYRDGDVHACEHRDEYIHTGAASDHHVR